MASSTKPGDMATSNHRGQPVADGQANGRAKDVFDELANHVVSDHSLDGTLQLLVDLAQASLSGADAIGISLRRKSGVITKASTNAKTLEVDQLQYDAGSGPCLQAMEDGKMQYAESMLTESRWPGFTNKALYSGIQSILSYPLSPKKEIVGALNCYSTRERAFEPADVNRAEAFAARAAVVLINAEMYHSATELAEQLQEALESRAVIDQAKGILMEREKISAEEAFDSLKIASQKSNTKVRELAQQLVNGANVPPVGFEPTL